MRKGTDHLCIRDVEKTLNCIEGNGACLMKNEGIDVVQGQLETRGIRPGARHRPGDPFHGTDGPLKLSPARQRDAIDERFVAACLEAGAPFNDDFNGATQEGAGWFDTKVWRGMRQSSARAYLERPPGNLTILADSPVLRIAMEGNRAVGLVLATGEVRARREVVLCLGAQAAYLRPAMASRWISMPTSPMAGVSCVRCSRRESRPGPPRPPSVGCPQRTSAHFHAQAAAG